MNEHFIPFGSTEEMFNYLKEQQKIAKEWAEKYRAVEVIERFDYFGLVADDLCIIGEKIDPVLPREEYEDEAEYLYEVETMEENKKCGYVWARWYSVACPDGELGTNHLSRCIPLTDDLGKAIIDLIRMK